MAAKKGKKNPSLHFFSEKIYFFVLKYCLDLNKLKTFWFLKIGQIERILLQCLFLLSHRKIRVRAILAGKKLSKNTRVWCQIEGLLMEKNI